MCGISGYISLSGQQNIEQADMFAMNRAIAHRGPDAEGYHFDQGLGFGHRRLSIIDVSSGQQPMHSDDQDITIVFNGEIYNYLDINKDLTSLGHTFNTKSDTETIIRAYQQWGIDCLSRLNGMFAFALWDKQKQHMLIARDRIGEKPLYYSKVDEDTFIFGSELKALKQHPKFTKALNYEAIEDFMTFGYIPEPKSLFVGTQKLQSGHYLLIKTGASSSIVDKKYWDLPTQGTFDKRPEPKEIIEKLKAATDIRMMSEVPLGAFLSGGVDSSAIVALMANLQTEPVNTVAIGFDLPEVNESHFAQLVADRYNTRHHLEIVDHESFDIIDRLADIYDEPFADSSALPTFKVCEAAKKIVTVCLSGDGGDEIFVGYRRYRLHKAESAVRSVLPHWMRKAIFSPLAAIYPKLDWAPRFLRAKTSFQSLSMENWEAYLNSISKMRSNERNKLYSTCFKNKIKGYSSKQVFADLLKDKHFDDPIKEAQYLDFKTWMPNDILTKVDRASMANSLEVRVPMLDHHFVEWAFQIDTDNSLIDKNGKANLKKGLEPLLSDENLYREKMGFSIPLSKWLRGPLKERLLASLTNPVLASFDLFEHTQLQRLYDDHLSGRSDNADALWMVMVLSDVLNKEYGSDAAQANAPLGVS